MRHHQPDGICAAMAEAFNSNILKADLRDFTQRGSAFPRLLTPDRAGSGGNFDCLQSQPLAVSV